MRSDIECGRLGDAIAAIGAIESASLPTSSRLDAKRFVSLLRLRSTHAATNSLRSIFERTLLSVQRRRRNRANMHRRSTVRDGGNVENAALSDGARIQSDGTRRQCLHRRQRDTRCGAFDAAAESSDTWKTLATLAGLEKAAAICVVPATTSAGRTTRSAVPRCTTRSAVPRRSEC